MTTFEFDELHLQIDGIYFGEFSGEASIDPDGSVSGVYVRGWDDCGVGAKKRLISFSRLPACMTALTFREKIGMHIIEQVERQFALSIRDQLDDARADLPGDFRDLGPSQAQRL